MTNRTEIHSATLLFAQQLEGTPIRIQKVHKESRGYFQNGCTGVIECVESDTSIWVRFDDGQTGVPDNTRSWYVGKLKHLGKKFSITQANTKPESARFQRYK